jgi:hypothetical protein
MSFLNSSVRHCVTLLVSVLTLITFTVHAESSVNYHQTIETYIEFDEPIQKELYAMSRAERKAAKKLKKHQGTEGLDVLQAEYDNIIKKNAEDLLQLVAYNGWPNEHLVGGMGVRAAFQVFVKVRPEDQKVLLPYYDETLQKELFEMVKSGDDVKNSKRLEEIVRQFGWPSSIVVGTKASARAFSMLLKAPLALKKSYWPMLVKEYEAGFLSGENIATLTDSILVEEGQEQLYGTQVSIKDGQVFVDPITNKESLNERRTSLGLMSMEDYLATYKELYL